VAGSVSQTAPHWGHAHTGLARLPRRCMVTQHSGHVGAGSIGRAMRSIYGPGAGSVVRWLGLTTPFMDAEPTTKAVPTRSAATTPMRIQQLAVALDSEVSETASSSIPLRLP
jgi:hypothetical protein